MTTRSLILHDYEVRAALAGTLGLVVRPVKGLGDVAFSSARLSSFNSIWGPDAWVFEAPMDKDVTGYEAVSRGLQCPLGVPGDRLCCRETWGHTGRIWEAKDATKATDGQVVYQIDHDVDGPDFQWWSPATMPAWASRITLEVVGVRCCRLGDLTADDARMAGFNGDDVTALGALCLNWQERYQAKRFGIETRPWAWAAEVRRIAA